MECCLLDWLITAYCGPCALSQELNQLARYERRPKPVPMVPVMMPAMPVMYPGAPQPMMMAPMGYSENVMIQPAVMYPPGAQPGMLMMMVGRSAYQCQLVMVGCCYVCFGTGRGGGRSQGVVGNIVAVLWCCSVAVL